MGEITAAPQVWSERLRGQESEDRDFKKSQDKATGTLREVNSVLEIPSLGGRTSMHQQRGAVKSSVSLLTCRGRCSQKHIQVATGRPRMGPRGHGGGASTQML